MQNEHCYFCGQLTSSYFLKEISIGRWPFNKKVKICILCLAKKQEGY
jgi:hypothetical protein